MTSTLNYINHSAISADTTSTTNFASAWQQQHVLSRANEITHENQHHVPVAIEIAPPQPTSKSEAQSPQSLPSPGKSTTTTNTTTNTTTTTTTNTSTPTTKKTGPARLNKFVRRLHDMLNSEQEGGVVEWRKGLLVLHSTDTFTKKVLPKYFNTKNFKTFRRQLNYYGFVHVRSFSTTGSSTTALWVNQDLARRGTSSISSVLMLKRVEPCDSAKTAEGRRVRKEEAANTVEDIGISTRALQMEQIRQLAMKATEISSDDESCTKESNQTVSSEITHNVSPIPSYVHCSLEIETQSNSSEATPDLSCCLPTQTQNLVPTEIVKQAAAVSFPTMDDAANLLIMFSKS